MSGMSPGEVIRGIALSVGPAPGEPMSMGEALRFVEGCRYRPGWEFSADALGIDPETQAVVIRVRARVHDPDNFSPLVLTSTKVSPLVRRNVVWAMLNAITEIEDHERLEWLRDGEGEHVVAPHAEVRSERGQLPLVRVQDA